MAITITRQRLEEIVNRNIAQFSQFVTDTLNTFSRVRKLSWTPHFLRKVQISSYDEQGESQQPTQPYAVKAKLSGYELGAISQMSFFPKLKAIKLENGEVLTPEHQRVLIDYFDRVSKEIHRGISRDAGGPYEAHPIDMIKWYVKTAKSLRLPIDYRPISVDLLHDVAETKLKAISDEINEARKQGLEDKVESLTSQVKVVRAEFVNNLYDDLVEHVQKYAIENGLSENQTRALITHGALIIGAIDWLTRHIEDKEVIQSADALRRIYTVSQYATTGVGGPFQSRVLEVLGVKEGYEPAESYTLRLLKRVLDRIALSLEVKRRFSNAEAEELEDILHNNPWFREVYGKINFKGQDYARAYILDIVFRNYVILHNINGALVNHGRQIYEQRKSNPLAYQYFRGLQRAREVLLEITGRIIQEKIKSYEEEFEGEEVRGSPYLKREAECIRKGVEDLNPSHFEIVTGYGPITRLNRLDAELSKKQWASFEESWYAKLENYKDWLMLAGLDERFTDTRRNRIKRGNYQLFTIDGLTDKLEINPARIVRYTVPGRA